MQLRGGWAGILCSALSQRGLDFCRRHRDLEQSGFRRGGYEVGWEAKWTDCRGRASLLGEKRACGLACGQGCRRRGEGLVCVSSSTADPVGTALWRDQSPR